LRFNPLTMIHVEHIANGHTPHEVHLAPSASIVRAAAQDLVALRHV
jgi:hypothetical protein